MKKIIKRRPIGRRVAIGVIILTLLSTLSICLFSYYIYRKDAMLQYTQRALDISISVASSIEADKFLESVDKESEDEYWHEVKVYLDAVKTNTGLEYLYIITAYEPENNIYRYYCEGERPEDDPESIGGYGYVEEDPTVFDPEALITIQTGECTITEAYYSEMFGYLVTGFAPIFDENNMPVAAVGADINVSKPAKAANLFGIYIVSAALLFSIVFALISKRYIQYLVKYSLGRITAGTLQLAEGNLNFQARATDSGNKSDDIGRLYANFAMVISTFKMLIDDMNNMSSKHANGDYEARMDESKYTGAYLEVVRGVNEMTFMYVNNFMELLDAVKSYGNGNFEANVNKYPGKLSVGNAIVDELRNNLIDVNKEITTLAETALSGDLSSRAKAEGFEGDWSKIIVNLNSLIDAFVLPIKEASNVLTKLSEGHLDAKMTRTYMGDFSLIKDNLNSTVDELAAYIKEIRTVLEAVSRNDLTVNTTKRFMGDFAAIEEAMQSIISAHGEFFREIGQIAGKVDVSASQIAETGRQMSQSVDGQHNAIQELTASVSTVNTQARDNAKNADDADSISAELMQDANSCSSEMKKMLSSMEAIKEASNNIAQIMKVIDGIASQTKLLALNAAVEAARAGEHGKGFAVVAEEVKNLATRSLESAKQTQELIDDTLTRVNEGVILAEATSESLDRIVGSVANSSSLISSISASSKEQASAVTFINDGINQISGAVQNNSVMADENVSSSAELANQSKALNHLLSSVKLR